MSIINVLKVGCLGGSCFGTTRLMLNPSLLPSPHSHLIRHSKPVHKVHQCCWFSAGNNTNPSVQAQLIPCLCTMLPNASCLLNPCTWSLYVLGFPGPIYVLTDLRLYPVLALCCVCTWVPTVVSSAYASLASKSDLPVLPCQPYAFR